MGISMVMGTLQENLAEAVALEKSGLYRQALDVFKSGMTEWPKAIGPLMGAGRTARAINDNDAALGYFRAARLLFPADPVIVMAIFRLELDVDAQAAKDTAQAGVDQFPDHLELQTALMWAKFRCGDESVCDSLDLDAELENPRLPQRFLNELLHAKEFGFLNAEFLEKRRRLAQIFPNDMGAERYANRLVESGHFEEALAVFTGLSSTEIMAQKHAGLAVCFAALGQFENAEKHLDAYFELQKNTYAILTTCALLASEAADMTAARDLLKRINAKYKDAGVEQLINFLSAIRPAQRELIKARVGESIFELSDGGTNQSLVLIFPGFAAKMGMMPFKLIDRFFAGYGINVGWLLDRTGCLYWNGVKELGATKEATIIELKARLVGRQTDRLYTLGSSGGSFGAMVYGHTLQAQQVLTFSGPTDLRKSFLSERGDTRAKAVIHGLNRKLNDDQLNLRDWLEKQENPVSMQLFYCEREIFDKLQAQNIAHLSQATLHPIKQYDQHDSVSAALGTGQLLEAFTAIAKDATSYAANR